MDLSLITLGILIVILILALRAIIHIVPEYQRLIVFRLGSFEKTAGPGIVLLLPPPIQSVAQTVDLREFVDYLKKNGASVKQAHGGIGSSSHMACLLFTSQAGVQPSLVAYRGTGPAMNDLIGGHVDFFCEQRFDGAIERHADQRDDLRTIPANLSIERLPALDVVGRHKIIDAGARPRDQVRDAEPELRQTIVVFEGDRFGHEAGFEEQLPEPIREPREVMPCHRRAHAGVDADKQHTHAGFDTVFQPEGLPRARPFRAESSGYLGVVWHTILR